MTRPNCIKCMYYYVTWKPQQPHGCKYFGFISKTIPSMVVFKNSNEHCQAFVEKIISSE